MPRRKPYTCVHCGRPCSNRGHLRVESIKRPLCPNTRPVTVVRERSGVARVGFCCPPGHACEFGTQLFVSARDRRSWRGDPPTFKQVEYLQSLGYDGPKPTTKGEAHDLLDEYINRAVVSGDERGINLRRRREEDE